MDPTVLAPSYWPLQGAGAGRATPHTRGDGSDVLPLPPDPQHQQCRLRGAFQWGETHPQPAHLLTHQGHSGSRALTPPCSFHLESTPAVTTSFKPLLCTLLCALYCVVYFNEEIPWRHESCLIYTRFSDGIHTAFDFSGFFRFLDVNWEFHMPLCCAKSLQSRPILCDPMDQSPPGSSVDGILQARILERVAMPSSRGSSWHRHQTESVTYPALVGRFIIASTTWEAHARQI